MEILLAVIMFYILYKMFTYSSTVPTIKKECKPHHKWEYRKQPDSDEEYMICKECNKTPTQIIEGL